MSVQHKYPIYDVSDALSSGVVEYLGTKRKGWYSRSKSDGTVARILFKRGRDNTGENWAEKVACELAELLDIPHAIYDLAYLDKDKPCVISPSFLDIGEELIHGNQLIEGFDKNLLYKNTKHSLVGILRALQQNKVQAPWSTSDQLLSVTDARGLFLGYMCFDAWIANTDRHAENWGIITKPNNINVLAPTFDHASSLGRNESDENRIKRMQTKDTGYNVQAYVQRAMAPIYDENGNMLNTTSLVQECRGLMPQATDHWIEKIVKLTDNYAPVREILDRVPDQFMSEPARDFAMAILQESAARLRGLQHV